VSVDVSNVSAPNATAAALPRPGNRHIGKLWLAAISLMVLLAIVTGAPLLGNVGLRIDLGARTLSL